MKKLKLFTLLISISILSFSQITHKGVISSPSLNEARIINLENSGSKYYVYDGDNLELKLYNTDLSIFKTVTIDTLSMDITGYPNVDIEGAIAISENLFDNDDEVEFLVLVYASKADWSSQIKKTFVINEDGVQFFEADNQKPAVFEGHYNVADFIKNVGDNAEMMLYEENETGDYDLHIYTLPGKLNDEASFINVINSGDANFSANPNPARNYTVISYEIPDNEKEAELIIYDLQGKVIKSYNVDNTFNQLRISTENLKSGTYLYNLKINDKVYNAKKMIVVK